MVAFDYNSSISLVHVQALLSRCFGLNREVVHRLLLGNFQAMVHLRFELSVVWLGWVVHVRAWEVTEMLQVVGRSDCKRLSQLDSA